MEEIGRRSALALGVAAMAATALVSSRGAMAQAYGPNEGKEVAPGVRVVELGEREAIIPGYKTVKMIDVVFQPGSHAPQETMEHDMVCHMTEGELRILQNGQEFRAKKGDCVHLRQGHHGGRLERCGRGSGDAGHRTAGCVKVNMGGGAHSLPRLSQRATVSP
jgi:quercetin dioxygenase-like cupin family protein